MVPGIPIMPSLPQDHLVGGALQGPLVFSVPALPTADRMCDGGEGGVKGNSYTVWQRVTSYNLPSEQQQRDFAEKP